MKSKLTEELRFAIGKLSSKSKGNLERVLFQGDREGAVYSYQDLVNGGIGGVKLTDQEYVAYARTRKVLDDMWWLKNMEVKQKAEARGAKFVTIGEQRGFPSVFDDIAVARGKYQSTDDFKKVYDPLSKATVSTMSNERMQVLYDQGFVLSKLENTGEFWNIDKARFKWAFVRKDEVKDLPMSMLNYKEGYVPRIYDKAYFFVKKVDGHVKDGDKVHKIMKADRYFDNASDAEKYKQQLIAEGTKADEVAVVFDREPMNNADLDGDIINIFGGLYASPRKAEPLKFGLEGQEAKLVEPLQAIQQYMHHIGNRLPVAQFRIGMQEKWLNDATDILGKRPVGGFDLAIEEVDKARELDTRKRKFLQKAHEQIRTLSNVPTTDEQALQGKFVSVGKSLEELSPKLKGAASFMYSLAQKNPISAAKAATHHMLLGTFSAAQYPIQALGATIAMSINPVYATKGMPKFFAFTQLDNIKDPAAKAAKIKSLSKALGSPDLEDAYRLWTRSGYRDSVLVTNGDYATLANGLPYDGNLVRRLFDKGEFFFKSGELVNMRISFATAYERWKDLNKGKALDDQALKDIFARSEQFRLNMGQGNRARFQKGAISVPLQFQQVHTKFLEAIGRGSAFTPIERAKLILGQTSLYGTMGIPLGQQLVAYFADVMDIDTKNISPEALNTAKRGMTGLMVNNILGFDAEISGRVSIAGGIADTAWDMLFEDKNLLSIAGPTGAIADRFWNGPIDVLWKGFKGTVSADKLTMSQQGEILQNLGIAFAEIPSGPRNAIIAGMLWESGMVRDSKGRVLWVEDPQLKDVLFRAVGFQSMKVQEYYDLLQSVRKQEDTERHMVDSLAKMFMRAAISLDEGDEAKAEAAALTMAVMRSSVSDAAARNRIMKSVSERLKINDKARELVEKAWKKSNDWSTPATQSWSILKQEAVYQDEGE
jgi:hypothetical protein